MAKYYGVKEGKVPGVYREWKECEKQIKGYSGAVYKKFDSEAEARAFVNDNKPVKEYKVEDIGVGVEVFMASEDEIDYKGKIVELEEKIKVLEEELVYLRELTSRGGNGDEKGKEKKNQKDKEEQDNKNSKEKSSEEKKECKDNKEGKNKKSQKEIVAYVDGSYKDSSKEYSYGMVIVGDERVEEYFESYRDEYSQMRNVAGEIKGAMKAMELCLERGVGKLYLHYDYIGIENWAKEDWKANKKGTQNYRDFYKSIKDRLEVEFIKVKAHSGDKYNEEADRLAKKALGL